MTPTITYGVFIWAILGSTVVATIVGFLLGWVKDYFQRKADREQKQFEKLYGTLTYHLLAMKVLTDNKDGLMEEIRTEYSGNIEMKNTALVTELKPLILRWHDHKDKLKEIIANNSGYLNKDHVQLVEDFLDGCLKREIADEGKNHRATEERMDKLLTAVKALQDKLLS